MEVRERRRGNPVLRPPPELELPADAGFLDVDDDCLSEPPTFAPPGTPEEDHLLGRHEVKAPPRSRCRARSSSAAGLFSASPKAVHRFSPDDVLEASGRCLPQSRQCRSGGCCRHGNESLQHPL